MMYIFTYFYAILFPPAPAVCLVTNENPTSFLRFFSPRHTEGSIALMNYATPQVAAAITANKFHHDTHAATLLAGIMSHWITTLPQTTYTIVPIPLSRTRLRERGHNQVTTVARQAIAQRPAVALNERILIRTRHTKAQSHLSRSDRLHNIDQAFSATFEPSLTGTTFILLDDVTTTGTTMQAAKAALRQVYPINIIICVALAH